MSLSCDLRSSVQSFLILGHNFQNSGAMHRSLKMKQNNSISASKYTLVADLVCAFLVIPASSERIWSREARILSRCRARLKDKLVSPTMFMKGSSKFLRKYHCVLAKQDHLI
jgi:hypothetical protein